MLCCRPPWPAFPAPPACALLSCKAQAACYALLAAAGRRPTLTPNPRHTKLTPALLPAGSVLSPRYALLPVDLRRPDDLAGALEAAGLDLAAPTFVLAECVLVYLEPEESAGVVRWLGSHLAQAVMAIYEQASCLCACFS